MFTRTSVYRQALGKPRTCDAPIVFHRPIAHVERAGRFRDGQAGKEPKLHNRRGPWVKLRELLQGIVEVQDVDGAFRRDGFVRPERVDLDLASTLFRPLGTGVVDQDLSHGFGSQGQEVGPVKRTSRALVPPVQLQECLVDEDGGLEGVSIRLGLEVPLGDRPQFAVHRPDQSIGFHRGRWWGRRRSCGNGGGHEGVRIFRDCTRFCLGVLGDCSFLGQAGERDRPKSGSLLKEIQEMLVVRALAPLWLLVNLGLAGIAFGQNAIIEVPRLAGADAQFVRCMSGDGSVIAGSAIVSGQLNAFRWTRQNGTESIGSLGSGGHTLANGISADGRVVVGQSGGRAFRWTASGGMQALQDMGAGSAALAASGDGWKTVGWIDDPSGSLITLPSEWSSAGVGLFGDAGLYNFASSTSRDGYTVFGTWFGGGGCGVWRYVAGHDQTVILSQTSGILQVRQCNASGSVVVGNYSGSSGTAYPFIWSESSGSQTLLPITGYALASAEGINGGGDLIVGSCRLDTQGPSTACLWDSSLSAVELSTYLGARGVDLAGWSLSTCTAVSDDGRVFVGDGVHNGVPSIWVATVPSPTPVAALGIGAVLLTRRRQRQAALSKTQTISAVAVAS